MRNQARLRSLNLNVQGSNVGSRDNETVSHDYCMREHIK